MRKQIQIALIAAGLAWHASHAAGSERVLLTNGFAMECNHHALVGSAIRLYMSAGDASYIEMKPEEIIGYESLPDAARSPSSGIGEKPEPDPQLSRQDLGEMLAEAGRQHNLDADLLASIVKAESNGNTRAVSRAGARGLMQLMPGTATEQGVSNSFEPRENLRGGTAYLDSLLERYHDNIALALAAYNAGPGAVDRYHGIPPFHETRVYVARVIHEFNRRVRAREEARQSRPSGSLQASSPR